MSTGISVYVGSELILLYFEYFVLVWLILLLIIVVRTNASDCLEDHFRVDFGLDHPWVGTMSTSKRWSVNSHTARCTIALNP